MKNKISSFLHSPIVQILCRFLLGALFIYASYDKILHPQNFAEIIYQYRILPNFLIHPAALILPWVEFFCGIALISGLSIRGAAFLLSSLLLVFILALGINAARGWSVACGCFSTSAADKHSPVFLILRDLLFLLPGLIILFYYKKREPAG